MSFILFFDTWNFRKMMPSHIHTHIPYTHTLQVISSHKLHPTPKSPNKKENRNRNQNFSSRPFELDNLPTYTIALDN